MTLGAHDQAEEGLLLLLPVDLHPTPEEPVTAVLTRGGRVTGSKVTECEKPSGRNMFTGGLPPPVGLGQVKALHAGGVALDSLEQ